MTPEDQRRSEILMPYAKARTDALKRNGTRLVHYTSAEVAISIISNKSIWLRNAATMNDFMEIHYGMSCLRHALASPAGDLWRSSLDLIHPGLHDHVHGLFFDTDGNSFRYDTYLASFSEHGGTGGTGEEPDEDKYGRLSMWRAYGGNSGTALVFYNTPFITENAVLNAFSSPVAYFTKEMFAEQLSGIARSISENLDAFQGLSLDALGNMFYVILTFAVLSTKHPGFAEEREWRVIYLPNIYHSEVMERDVQCVAGIPQIIYKIPLKDIPEKSLSGLGLSHILDRIIVGPTMFPYPAWQAMDEVVRQKVGVTDKVIVSDIPLRR